MLDKEDSGSVNKELYCGSCRNRECAAEGPFRETLEEALEAFCNPAEHAKRISKLKSALLGLLFQPVTELALVTKHERGCSAWIDRSTIEEAVKAIEKESEETPRALEKM